MKLIKNVEPKDAPEGMVDALVKGQCSGNWHQYPVAKSYEEALKTTCYCGQKNLGKELGRT